MLPSETAEASVKRHYTGHTEKALSARCVMAPYRGTKPRAGAKRYTFAPNAAYGKELKAKADPNEVGDPPCGDWGITSDGIQYYEVHPGSGARKAAVSSGPGRTCRCSTSRR